MVRAVIEFDDGTYERLQSIAERRQTSVEKLVAEAAGRLADTTAENRTETLADFLDSVKDISFDTNGWKWNRDELYDRKAIR